MKKLKTFLMVGFMAVCSLFVFTACGDKLKEPTLNPTINDANVYFLTPKTLDSIEIELGKNDTKGEIRWVDEDKQIRAGEYEYQWEFVPENDDYKTVKGFITITGYQVYDLDQYNLTATVDYTYNLEDYESIVFNEIDYNRFNVEILTENIYTEDNELRARISTKSDYYKILGDNDSYLSSQEKIFNLVVDFSDVELYGISKDYNGVDAREDINYDTVLNKDIYGYEIEGEEDAYKNAGLYEDVNVIITPKNSNITVKYDDNNYTSKKIDIEVRKLIKSCASYSELAEAVADMNVGKIILTDNITSVENNQLSICATGRDIDLILDLNGYNLEAILKTGNISGDTYNNTCNLSIINSDQTNKSVVGIDGQNWGLRVYGDERTTVDLSNITFFGEESGLISNGLCSGATINATGCDFIATKEANLDGVIDSAGAYLPGYYTCTFNNCTFTGGNGVYAKSGEIIFRDCVINGTSKQVDATYYGNGYVVTGDAIILDATYGYHKPLNVQLISCTLSSTNGYLVQEVVSDKSDSEKATYVADVSITNCKNSSEEDITSADIKWETSGAVKLEGIELTNND